MARFLPTLTVPKVAEVPTGTITPGEWTAAQSDIAAVVTDMGDVKPSVQLADTRTYDTRAFATIQDAIDAAYSNGGGNVFVGDSELTPQTLTLRDGVYLTGRGIGATTLKVQNITGSGSISALPGLGTTVSTNSRTITFASAHGLQAGDVFCIYDTTDYSFNTARVYYRAGEFCKVRTVVSSTQVTITQPTYASYSTGAARQLYKLNPIRTGVSDMTVECSTGSTGIFVEFGSDLEFHNLKMSGSDVSHLTIARCYDVAISRVSAFDHQVENGTNYGITVSNSQRIRIDNVDLETRRHGLVTGHSGSPSQPCLVPVRDLIVSNSYINGLSDVAGICGNNLHGNAEFVRYVNCTFPSGSNPAGDNIEYRACTFGSAAWGCAVQCMEMLGVTLSFIGCTFNATDNFDYETGLIHLRFQEYAQRPHGALVFHDNIINLGTTVSNGATHNAIVLRMVGNSAPIDVRQASFRNNVINAASTTNRLGIRIVTIYADKWTHIEYVDNGGRLGALVDFTAGGTSVYFEGYGAGVPAFVAQRGSTYQRRVTAGTDTGRLYVNQSGTADWTMK